MGKLRYRKVKWTTKGQIAMMWFYQLGLYFIACDRKLKKKRKKVKLLSPVWLFATPWTVTHQAPLSMEFSRQEYWGGLPFPSPVGNKSIDIFRYSDSRVDRLPVFVNKFYWNIATPTCVHRVSGCFQAAMAWKPLQVEQLWQKNTRLAKPKIFTI